MARTLGIATVVLIAVLVLAGTVSANVEFVGGATYNTYSIDWSGLPPELSNIEFNSGLGAYVGAQYWINSALAVGAQLDYFSGTGQERFQESDYDGDGFLDTESLKLNAVGTGYLATLTTKLNPSDRVEIRPFAAIGMYQLTINEKASIDFSDPSWLDGSVTIKLKGDNKIGGKVGVDFSIELAPDLSLGATAAYRFIDEFSSGTIEMMGIETKVDDLEGLNASGFSAGAALSLAF